MPRRIVLFGASGATGRLVAHELVAARARPVLAGRRYQNLAALGVQLGHGLDIAVADSSDPESVASILRRGDVLVSTVGSFARLGEAAVRAAIDTGATYVDCAAEPAFLRRVFVDFDPRARDAGVALIPGLGFRYVAGSIAAELALEGLGAAANAVDVAYSSDGASCARESVGGLEPVTLPRLHPGVTAVDVFTRSERRLRGAAVPALAERLRGFVVGMRRSSGTSAAVATAYSADGSALRAVRAHGPDAPTLTARLLAWGAMRLASREEALAGALSPVEAFGLGPLREACAVSGLAVDHG